VGEFLVPRNRSLGFLYSGGSYTLINPGFGSSTALGINNAGAIVGDYGVPGQDKGFLLKGSIYTTFSVPDSVVTSPFKISNSEQIVGAYADSNHLYHGFLLSGGSYTLLNAPGAIQTVAVGINNSGQIAGYYEDASDNYHGFLLSDGNYRTIDAPGSTVTEIWGINDAGQIVGGYFDAVSNLHGFLGTPTPEPSTLLLLSLASVGLVVMAPRRILR
jgi:probable HAF family extracellular repeat protein